MIAALRRLFSVSRPTAPTLSNGAPMARRRAPHRKSRIGGYAARFRPTRRPPHTIVPRGPISLTA